MNADDLVPGGFPCDQQLAISLPPREDVVHTDHWRVAHAFNSALPGWLVLLPTRHVASFTELTPAGASPHADREGGGSRRARWARTSPWRRTGGCHRLREDIPHAVLRGRGVLPLAPPPGAKAAESPQGRSRTARVCLPD